MFVRWTAAGLLPLEAPMPTEVAAGAELLPPETTLTEVVEVPVLHPGIPTGPVRPGPIQVTREVMRLHGGIPPREVQRTDLDLIIPIAIPGARVLPEEDIEVLPEPQARIAVREATDPRVA